MSTTNYVAKLKHIPPTIDPENQITPASGIRTSTALKVGGIALVNASIAGALLYASIAASRGQQKQAIHGNDDFTGRQLLNGQAPCPPGREPFNKEKTDRIILAIGITACVTLGVSLIGGIAMCAGDYRKKPWFCTLVSLLTLAGFSAFGTGVATCAYVTQGRTAKDGCALPANDAVQR